MTANKNKLPNVSESEKAHLEELTRRLVNKLLHAPLQTLRQSDSPHVGVSGAYVHAVEKLFGLGGSGATDANGPLPADMPADPGAPAESVARTPVTLPPPADAEA